MPDDYAYINARIKVMRNGLFGERHLEEALSSQSYAEFLRVLSENGFAEDLGAATEKSAGLAELDAALSQNLYATTQRVLSFAQGQGDAAKELGALLLKWDLLNLKTLARGLSSGRNATDILAGLVAGGSLKRTSLEAAATSGDLSSAAQAISLSGHPLAKVFREGVVAYTASGNLLDLEVVLDQGFYRQARKASDSSILRRYFALDIDLRNALTALQLRGQTADSRYFVSGGRKLTEADFQRIAAGDNAASNADVAKVIESGSLAGAENAIRQLLAQEARNLAMADPLGVGIAINFLRQKEIEIAQLRLIGRGKFYNLPTEQLRQELSHA